MNRRTRELIKQLQSESPKERYLAAAELAKRKDIEALPALNKVATFDQNENVRTMAYNAVRFLSQIKNQMDQEELRRR
ncbi:MAG: HEAT repeat domain-containing protein, partial [Chloroflexi bacterium]